MIKNIFLSLISLILFSPFAASQKVVITSPQAGQVLQGNVKITGTVLGNNFNHLQVQLEEIKGRIPAQNEDKKERTRHSVGTWIYTPTIWMV